MVMPYVKMSLKYQKVFKKIQFILSENPCK